MCVCVCVCVRAISGCVANLPGLISCELRRNMSHEKKLGWLGFIGDDKLSSYMGIIS